MEKTIYEGKVWKFDDNVSTDSIAPGRLMHLRSQPEEYAKHVFEDKNPEFVKNVKEGDLVVAGSNFGCGSSREFAPLIIKLAGVSAILAKSVARIFYRNAVNIGMLVIECDTEDIHEGDEIVFDLSRGEVTKKNDPSFKVTFQLGKIQKRILEEGGLLNYIEKYDFAEL